jgi:WD40 repeat protein
VAAGFRGQSPADAAIGIWDTDTGKSLRWMAAHDFDLTCLAFAADASTLVSGSSDCVIRLWDTATGKEQIQTPGHRAPILDLAYSPDGTRLATASMDGTLRLWDTATGLERARLDGHGGWVCRVAFSPDGSQLASTHADRQARLWDVASGKEIRRWAGGTGRADGSLAFGADGSTLAATSPDGAIRLWETASGKQLERWAELGPYTHFAFLPDGNLISGSSDTKAAMSTVRLRERMTGNELRRWMTPQRLVNSISLSPDGRYLAVGGSAQEDGVRIWVVATGKERAGPPGLEHGWISSLAFSSDGRVLAVLQGGEIGLWELATNRQRCRLAAGASMSHAQVLFAPAGGTLASAGADSTVLIWDLRAR